jgi:membrane dipeptidase
MLHFVGLFFTLVKELGDNEEAIGLPIIDAHCDALYKMYNNANLMFDQPSIELDVTYPGLRAAGMLLQFFAIFLPESRSPQTFQDILDYINLFHNKILNNKHFVLIKQAKDLVELEDNGKIGALLSLEGVGALNGHLPYLDILYQLGLRAAGVAWNDANWAADGAMEPRKGGLTVKGKRLVEECNRLGIILDVSHLSENGFWDLASTSTRPFIASHSNAHALCPHPRNLTDEQIKAVIECGGMIGITFVPAFLDASGSADINHVLNHLDHICSLGGTDSVGFGSDLDGIDRKTKGLEKTEGFVHLMNKLSARYNKEEVDKFLYGNWRRFLLSELP